jgi:hypothetical protein
VSIQTPVANQEIYYLDFHWATISGFASDNMAPLKSVRIKLVRRRNGVTEFWNGTTFSTTPATVSVSRSGEWNLIPSPLPEQMDVGVYTVYATAVDGEGNSTTTPGRSFSITGTPTSPGTSSVQGSSSGNS